MANEETKPNPSEMDEQDPPEAFSMVWVKMEIEDEGIVQGIDEPPDDYDEYNYPDNDDDEQNYPVGNLEQNRDGDDMQQQYQVNFSENLKKGPAKRCRKKATVPNRRSSVDPNLKKFVCQYCDYRAMHKNALKYHTMKHTNEAPIACKFCAYTTKYPNSMKQHVLGQHTDKDDPAILALPVYKCNLCEYSTRFKWNLAVHRRKHAAEKSFQCDMCGFASAHRHSFIKHIKRHQPKENAVYQCDKCPFKTKFEGHISRHLALIHKEVSEKALKCDHCEFYTRVRWRLNQHKKNSRQTSSVHCGARGCDFASEYICEVKLHRKKHAYVRPVHGETIKKQIDPPRIKLGADSGISPNNSYNQLPNAPLHLNNTTGPFPTIPPPLPLKQSNEDTQQTNNAKEEFPENPINTPDDKFYILDKINNEIDWRKIEVLEIPGVEKMFSCKDCDYSAKYKASVQRHFQRLHTSKDVRPYKCLKCGFTTKTKDQIALHIKRSKSEILLNCHLCAFLSYFKCQNAVHQKRHYPLKCSLCDYVCKQNYTLQEHFRIVHLGQALQCKYCDYIATGKSNLSTHQVKHTCESELSCSLCDYKTVRRRLLQVHIQKNHPDERIQPKIINDSKIAALKTEGDQYDQQTIEHLVKNVQEQIKKFGDKLQNETKQTEENATSADNVEKSMKNEVVSDKIENVSVKIERLTSHNIVNNGSEPHKVENEAENPQPTAAVIQPAQSDFQMRYAESLNQSYYENALRYAGSYNPSYFERW